MLRQTESKRFWWDFMILMLAILICYTLPMKIAFDFDFQQTLLYNATDIFVQIAFAADIVVQLITSQYDQDGNEIFDQRVIAKNYIQTVTFWIDLAATRRALPVSVGKSSINTTPCPGSFSSAQG